MIRLNTKCPECGKEKNETRNQSKTTRRNIKRNSC